jgi:hypothetical protein
MSKNITISISAKTYYEIRVACAQHDDTVSQLVARFLERLPGLQYVRYFPLPSQRSSATPNPNPPAKGRDPVK